MESLITYRKAESIDSKRIAELAEKIWTEHYTPLIGTEQVRYMLQNFQSEEVIQKQIDEEGYAYFLAEENGTPVAYSALQPSAKPETNDSLFLSKFYVEKSYRNKGCGRALLDFALAVLNSERKLPQSLPYTTVWLTVNKHNAASITAYQKLGFTIVESIETDIGNGFIMDDYKMIARITGVNETPRKFVK